MADLLVGWGDRLRVRWKAVEALRFDDPRAEKGIRRLIAELREIADEFERRVDG